MSKIVKYKCDVCGKEIETGYQLRIAVHGLKGGGCTDVYNFRFSKDLCKGHYNEVLKNLGR